MLNGIIASEGIAIGKAVIHVEQELVLPEYNVATENVQAEFDQFKKAKAAAISQLDKLYNDVLAKLGEEEAEVFEGHMEIADDESLEEEVLEFIQQGLPVAVALHKAIESNVDMLLEVDKDYIRERVADFRDVGSRMIKIILGISTTGLNELDDNSIILANDLTPSDTAQLDLNKVLGFVTEIGGRTSHSAIMARSLEIPALVGCQKACSDIKDGELIILDAINNQLIANPSEQQLTQARERQDKLIAEKSELLKLKDAPAVTLDGKHFELCANIGTPKDAEGAVANGAEGIGLYRTEFLFMDRSSMPSEQVQFEAYKAVAETMQDKPVIIRTLDIGGDKELPYMDLPSELNPFLGWRAIRMCLDRPEILQTQLRAILRASAFGKLRIMFPMVISVQEVKQLKAHVEQAKTSLREAAVTFDEQIEVGIMIETPAAVMIADQLIAQLDFFSIGTNDLTQYILAVDRGNESIAHLYDSFSPSVLRAIKRVIDASHAAGKWTGMCGEFAGDEQAALILAGLGLDEFSMSAPSVLKIKKVLRAQSSANLEALAEQCLNAEDGEAVRQLVSEFAL
ncbi:phosphoenolpyruvate-protein phosphotransferase [Endozoicomonas montiporae]|uniref:Phosphoenolpyruvate-protein phosphotransferase n=2 Tax=Endozoicomonas montiporae TaxID=1027273 RepID=A0A081N0H1_9GAMM|nr:phosphoenolpyruvate--protein phosphotransferase [Endozoicomonas montiporae]AMO54404.1 phosphoenolpyruvate-protein phosphotransferase [Endozoicomonas montiporae CL-33]KEQ11944.1 phosphoenolpyruvate-protein phosphotransferase [Endozoicomonas montiporae]